MGDEELEAPEPVWKIAAHPQNGPQKCKIDKGNNHGMKNTDNQANRHVPEA